MVSAKTGMWREISLLCLLALLWGFSYLFIKVAVSEIPPITLIAARVSIASIFLIIFLYWRELQVPRDGKTWAMLLIQATFNSIGAWTILAWGQQFIDSGLASVLNSTTAIFVFFITIFITRHEAVNILRLAGAILGLLGVIVIVGIEVPDGLDYEGYGQLAVIAGAILYAIASIYGKISLTSIRQLQLQAL